MTEQEFKLFKELAQKFEEATKGAMNVNIVHVESDGTEIDMFSLTESVDSLEELVALADGEE